MYLIPGSKSYYCKTCKARFAQVLNRTWLLKPKNPRRTVQLAIAAIGALLVFMCLYLFIELSQAPPPERQSVVVTEGQ